MKKHTLCCIGHVTLDKVVTPQSTVFMPGGKLLITVHMLSATWTMLIINWLLQ